MKQKILCTIEIQIVSIALLASLTQETEKKFKTVRELSGQPAGAYSSFHSVMA